MSTIKINKEKATFQKLVLREVVLKHFRSIKKQIFVFQSQSLTCRKRTPWIRMDRCVMLSKPAHPMEETETCKCSVFNNKFDWALTHKSSPNLKPQRSWPRCMKIFPKWNSCARPRLSTLWEKHHFLNRAAVSWHSLKTEEAITIFDCVNLCVIM